MDVLKGVLYSLIVPCVAIGGIHKGTGCIILYSHRRGLSALLVSTDRAMREPLERGTSDKVRFPRFFVC